MKITKLLIVLLSVLVASIGLSQSGPKTAIPKVASWTPVFMEDGNVSNNTEANETAEKTTREIFTSLGMEWIDQGAVNGALNQLNLLPSKSATELPTPKDMLALGKSLGVDYVVAYKCKWHAKTIVQILGLKTKADCESTFVIVDVKKAEVVYNPGPIKVDSEKKFSGSEVAGTLLLTPLVTFASGGPKTPHMKRAAQASVLTALEEWAKIHRPNQNRKIQ
jgi:hypothetical protein